MELISKIKSYFVRSRKPSLEEAGAIVEQLIDLGFLKFVSESEKPRIREQLIESVRTNYLDSEWDEECNSADRRSYHADNENLAEGDVGRCVLEMKDVLAQEGVRLESVEDDFGKERYQVVVNGIPHLICENSGDPRRDWWGLATKRLLEIVNSLLEDAGSKERLFAVYGGNDGRVILLTPEMHNLLRRKEKLFDDDWMPRSATDMEVDS